MSIKNTHGLLGIELRHLVAFDAVVSTGSFARAAEQLGYTQSAISLQIAALERAAGTRLLVRPGGRKPVVMTDAGMRMQRHAGSLAAQLQAAEADLTALAEGTVNTLRVGTFQSVSIRVLPDAVRRLIEERPGIEVRLHEASWDHELLDLVERGRLDLAFSVVPAAGPFEYVELMRDPYVLLVRTDSPLAERRVLPSLAELGRLPMIAYSRSTYGIEGLLRSRGIEPNVVFRTDESAALQRLVAAGVGSALVARLSIDRETPGVVAIDASSRVPARPICIAWHRDITPSDAARTFIAAARERCDELSSDLQVIARAEQGPPV
ncbi:MAG: LysR family transcriptional regulator [Gaiellales bacterium]